MTGRPRRHRSVGDGVDPYALHVFIPGALASGFLVSVGLLVGDAVRKIRGEDAGAGKVALTAEVLAEEVRAGTVASRRVTSGMRDRKLYAVVGGVSLGLAIAVIPGATWNFLNPIGYISDISWIWAVSMLLVVPLAALGVQLLRLVPEWAPRVVLAIGAVAAARFLFGNEATWVRAVAVAASIAGGVGLALLVSRWRRRVDGDGVPPSVRPLLRSTPLGRGH